MVSRFSYLALKQYEATLLPLKYAYTPDERLGPNAVEARAAAPVSLEVGSGTALLLGLLAGYLAHDFLRGGVGTALKGGIAKRIGG